MFFSLIRSIPGYLVNPESSFASESARRDSFFAVASAKKDAARSTRATTKEITLKIFTRISAKC